MKSSEYSQVFLYRGNFWPVKKNMTQGHIPIGQVFLCRVFFCRVFLYGGSTVKQIHMRRNSCFLNTGSLEFSEVAEVKQRHFC